MPVSVDEQTVEAVVVLLGCVMPRGDSDGDMELNKPALTIREIKALPLPS